MCVCVICYGRGETRHTKEFMYYMGKKIWNRIHRNGTQIPNAPAYPRPPSPASSIVRSVISISIQSGIEIEETVKEWKQNELVVFPLVHRNTHTQTLLTRLMILKEIKFGFHSVLFVPIFHAELLIIIIIISAVVAGYRKCCHCCRW